MTINKTSTRFFVVMTYLLFYIIFVITGITMFFITDNVVVITVLKHLCAWSSFFVLMIWFKKFFPDATRKDFFKDLFREKLNIKIVIGLVGMSSLIFLMIVFSLLITTTETLSSILAVPSCSLIPGFLLELTNGSVGEEFGWRGYYLTAKSKDLGILKASLVNGLLWGLWHVPLWFMTGFESWKLVVYVLSFMVSLMSCNVVIGYVFLKHRNLVYAIIPHFLNNFYLDYLLNGNLWLAMIFNAIFYFVAAICFIIFNHRKTTEIECSDVGCKAKAH